ncbi:DEAD/DEAH box helicase [Natronogracilivirgula saccharolytica]|uniref:DEAD/DEAH box helicase n=2 Tax=Natronogracilivirga saccharolytica TaxID=2812953 RepID=A0A8J7RPJ3_9BACT|nr:DEAD/DEAH box helicase [Natronogracilivirga saccharolytica]
MGFEKPTPIQESCIPLIMEGRDVLASAQTGTGKTAAFAIPVLEKLSEKKKEKKEGIRALIITPTRELAGQVDEAFFAIGYHTGLSTAKVYGGDDWGRQEKALNRGTNIIVATPGRLLDHIKIHDIDFSNLDFLILDEADRMLDMGFIPDITQIVSKLPKKRQTLLFSATLPQKIIQLARKMMNNPERVNMAPDNRAAEGVTQGMYYVEERDKLPLVLNLYENEKWPSAIIFMSTKRAVDKLSRELKKKGASVTSIHGDRSQAEREAALESFRKGEYRVIVATDVMARGIDVEGISHIINFSVPHDVEDYVHRIGRTARAEATGDAITLVSGQDRRYMENIIREMDSEIKKLQVPDLHGGKPGRKSGDSGQEQKGRKGKPGQNGRKKPQKEEKDSGSEEAKAAADESGQDQKQEQQSERPKRRRGRRRPGGNRRKGKKPQQEQQQEQAGQQQAAGQDQKKQQKEDSDTGSGQQQGRKKQQGRSKQQPRKGKPSSDDGGRKGGRQRKGPPRGRKPAGHKAGARGRKKPTGKEAERKELFDNITSPDMAKVNKSVSKKRGVWSKIKGIFGGE